MPKHNKCGCNCVPEASFNSFLENFDRRVDTLKEREERFVQSLVSTCKEVKILQQELQASRERVTALERRVDELESNPQPKSECSPSTRAPGERSSRSFVPPPEDACELLVTGLPSSLRESPSIIVKRILSFISLSSALGHVLTTREWRPKTYRGSARAVSVKFASPIVRNEVLKAVYAMKQLNSNDIFGAVSNCRKLKVTNLLSKSTHLLLMEACKLSKSSNFAPPIVNNGIVYMRKSKSSTLIPVYSDFDIDSVIQNCASQAIKSD